MTSAWTITAAVNPPRAAFLDFPLGHTAGRPNDLPEQTDILRAALTAFTTATPGSISHLPFRWADTDDWKATVMVPDGTDDRTERHAIPQYQTPKDAQTADPTCPTCIWLTD